MKYREIELPFWQDPQFHPYLRYQRDSAIIQVRCYLETADGVETDTDVIGQLAFSEVRAIEFERHTRRLSSSVETACRSSILEFKSSPLLSTYRKAVEKTAGSRSSDALLHYVVMAHDGDIHIVARSVDISSMSSGARALSWLDE